MEYPGVPTKVPPCAEEEAIPIGHQVGRPAGGGAVWASELWHCSDDLAGCCEVAWCFTCMQTRHFNALTRERPEVDWTLCLSVAAADYFCNGFASPMLACHLRTLIRQRYDLAGDVYSDFLVSVCCAPCATCQHQREMTLRGDHPGTWCGKDHQPLAAPEEMV